MKHCVSRRRQAGVSLVELAVAAVILGVAALVLWQFSVLQRQQQAGVQSASLAARARSAVVAYAALHARLPCPARNADGNEDCGMTSDGFLPFLTLGLPLPEAGQLPYGISRAAPALVGTARMKVLVPDDGGAPGRLVTRRVTLAPTGILPDDRMLDFCSALGAQVTSSGGGGSDAMAFFIDDAPSGLPGGLGGQRQSMTRGQLRSATGCGALYAAAGRAHYNAALGAASMVRALTDYQTQFDLAYGLAEWDVASGEWDLVNANYGFLKTAVKLPIAISSWLSSLSTEPQSASAIVATAATFVLDTINIAACAQNLMRFQDNLKDTDVNRDITNRLLARTVALDMEVSRNASLNSAHPWFLAAQDAVPVTPIAAGGAAIGAMAGGGALGARARGYAVALGGSGAAPGGGAQTGATAGLQACGDDEACQRAALATMGRTAAAQDSAAQSACLDPGSAACRATVQGIVDRNERR